MTVPPIMPVVPATIPVLEKPTPEDVAALLRARTKNLDGQEIGTFDDTTRPTGTEVSVLIDLAYAEVVNQSGAYLVDPCKSGATALIIVRAAMWVELSYWPEQVRSDRSVYQELADQYSAGLPRLVECVAGNTPGSGEAGDGTGAYRFGVLDIHGWTASPYYGAPTYGTDTNP